MGTGIGLQPGERGEGGTSAALTPSSVPILGTGTRPYPSLAVVVTPGCPHIAFQGAGAHQQLHPGCTECVPCPILHGQDGTDVPVHPDAEPFPGLGKCHQPFLRLVVTTVHFPKGHLSLPNRGDLFSTLCPPAAAGGGTHGAMLIQSHHQWRVQGSSLEGSYRSGGPVLVATAGLGPASSCSSSACRAL